MRYFLLATIFCFGCTAKQKMADIPDFNPAPGWVSVFQTYTSDTETSINILRPRLTTLSYIVQEKVNKQGQNTEWSKGVEAKVIKTTSGKHIHWKVDRIHLTNLNPKKEYKLVVMNSFRRTIIDYRYFKSLNLAKSTPRFIVGSCMSDSHAFAHIRSEIWDKMRTHKPDFVVLLGDQVYVDDFDFVKRGQATEFDIWTRYIDSFRKIPLFSHRHLIPILSIWDDHDFGTNNSNKTFKSRKAAEKVYKAFFGGEEIANVFDVAKNGVHFSFNGFAQKFVFMDNRYDREPSRKSPYGQWGKSQHKWFEKQIKQASGPIWLANGGQFFTKATFIEQKDGRQKQINETFVHDHPKHLETVLSDLQKIKQPVVFLSGDIHYSEISKIDNNQLGYPTYEVTSSPVHSYIFRAAKGPETWLNNPNRIVSVKEHNYLVVEGKKSGKASVDFSVKSYGVKQDEPYFSKKLTVQKTAVN